MEFPNFDLNQEHTMRLQLLILATLTSSLPLPSDAVTITGLAAIGVLVCGFLTVTIAVICCGVCGRNQNAINYAGTNGHGPGLGQPGQPGQPGPGQA